MKITKDQIIDQSVKLFAERGFDGVSTADIASALGITKGALYRHFESKQQIFDSIIEKMFALDAQRADEDQVPEKLYEEEPESYEKTEFSDFCSFTVNQFDFWTEEGFARDFRRMLTIEQYKTPQMAKLYQDVITAGPVSYSEDLLRVMLEKGSLNKAAEEMGPRALALRLFAPLKLAIEMADGGADQDELRGLLQKVTKDFENEYKKQ